jgi:hypothetical protein
LLDAQGCHITVGDLQLQAAVQGATRIQEERTLVLYPSHPAVTSPSEEEALERITADQRTLELLSNLSAHDMHAGVDTLLALHPTMSPHTSGLEWTTAVYISAIVSLSLNILYHIVLTRLRKMFHYFARDGPLEAEGNTTPAPETSNAARTSMEAPTTTPPVHSVYALH